MIQLNLAPPAIIKYQPRQSGQDNEGIGQTKHGERYLLKVNSSVCVAEFVGAALCTACGIPVASPTIVDFKGREVFGSRLESGVELPVSVTSLKEQIRNCANQSIFSAVLAIDLALGNGDRHWHNWLPQPQAGGDIFLRAVDFSRAWPTIHPPLSSEAIRGENTETVWREWGSLGIQYDDASAMDACDKIGALTSSWLEKIFEQLPVEWMVGTSGPELTVWWGTNWAARILTVRDFLKSGAWV